MHLSETLTATRGRPILSILYFTGCVANAQGNCDLVGRITTTAPDGKPYDKGFDAKIWVDMPPPGKDMLQLSQDYLGLVIDPDDQLGKYVVKVEIQDRVSKKTMTSNASSLRLRRRSEEQPDYTLQRSGGVGLWRDFVRRLALSRVPGFAASAAHSLSSALPGE